MFPATVISPLENRPLAREAAVAVLAFGAFLLWVDVLGRIGFRVVRALDLTALADSGLGSVALSTVGSGAVIVGGAAAFVAAFAALRDERVGLSVPTRSDASVVLAVVLVPAGAIAAVYLVAHAAGTSLSVLTSQFTAADASLAVVAVIQGLALVAWIPVYVLLAHALVQRTFRRATDAATAVALTTLLIGFAAPSSLGPYGSLVGNAAVTLLLVGAIALPAYAAGWFDRRWLHLLTVVPLVLFVGGLIWLWAGDIESLPDGLLALVRVGVVALAAYGYERTDSLVVPALAYVAMAISIDAITVLLEAGVRP